MPPYLRQFLVLTLYSDCFTHKTLSFPEWLITVLMVMITCFIPFFGQFMSKIESQRLRIFTYIAFSVR